ncbi:MAG: ATP-binding protein [Bacteroidia bacterium]
MHKYLLTLLLSLVSCICFAQSPIDSLTSAWKNKDLPDSSRIQAAVNLGNMHLQQGDSTQAMNAFNNAEKLANSNQDPAGLAHCLTDIGLALKNNRWYKQAEEYLLKTIPLFKQIKDTTAYLANKRVLIRLSYESRNFPQAISYAKDLLADEITSSDSAIMISTITTAGNANMALMEYDSALSYLFRADDFYANYSKPSPGRRAQNLVNIANLYLQTSQKKEALNLLLQASGLIENEPRAFVHSDVYICLSKVFRSEGEFEKALSYAKKSFNVAKNLTDRGDYLYAYYHCCRQLGINYHNDAAKGRNLDSAVYYYTEAYHTAKETGYIEQLSLSLETLGGIYLEKNQPDSALSYYFRARDLEKQIGRPMSNAGFAIAQAYAQIGRPAQAIPYFEEAVHDARELGDYGWLRSASNRLADCYKATGQHAKALKMRDVYIEARDTLENRKNAEALVEFEYERKAFTDSLAFVKEKAVSDLAYEQELNQRNNLLWGALALMLIAGLSFWFYRNRQQLRVRHQAMELEQERERQQQLAELNDLKIRFFANISHELRTPLTLILGPLSQLIDRPDNWDKEEVQDQLFVMQRNGKSLMQLITEILDLSKFDAQKMELQEAEVPITPLVNRLYENFVPQLDRLGLKHDLNIAVPSNLNIRLDELKFEKVFNNFLSNAIKFTPSGGKIGLALSEKGGSLEFSVQDTGQGIAEEELPHVFDRYFQTKNQDQGGTGIGLGLVRSIAQLMDGRAYAESRLGEGSSFYFEFPKKEVTALAESPVEEVVEELALAPIYEIGTDFSILLVEDNADMQRFVMSILEPRYKNVFVASNGVEGLKMLEEHGHEVDLIISDIMMPEMDGLTMLKEVKAHADWKSIPMVMLTALAAERSKLSALTIGVDDYVTKPFSVAELEARVQNLLYHAQQRKAWLKGEEASTQEEETEPKMSVSDKAWVDNMEQLIKDSLSEQRLNVEGLAEKINLSPRQLRRRLKGITGLSPIQFIKEVQLTAARYELEEGSVNSLADVAYKCGFGHQTTFSTEFRARFGKPPKEYLRLA